MTVGRRVLGVLVAAAYLMGVPGTVAAAGPNQLANGRVAPGSGSTTTAFTFTVNYVSDKGFAATSVVALVAGRSIPLRLVSGAATAGTYAGSATLPAGKWAVSFEARAAQGPDASLAGPTVTVTAPKPAAPRPTPPPPPKPPPPKPPPPPPAPTTAPVRPPTPPPAPPTTAATPKASASASATPTAPSTDQAASPTQTDRGSSATPDETAWPGSKAPGAPGGAVTVEGDSAASGGGAAAWVLGIVGMFVLAGLALLGRRRADDDPALASVSPSPPGPSAAVLPRDTARRIPGRVQGHMPEDPILAAMGVGKADSKSTLDAPLTRSVHAGPGERLQPPAERRPH